MDEFQFLDLVELGKRIKTIRIQLLKLSQEDFATTIQATQVQVSKLEKGIGLTTSMLLNIVNYLNNNGYKGCMLLDAQFDIENLYANSFESQIFIESLKEFKKSTNESIDCLINKLKFL